MLFKTILFVFFWGGGTLNKSSSYYTVPIVKGMNLRVCKSRVTRNTRRAWKIYFQRTKKKQTLNKITNNYTWRKITNSFN